MKAGGMSDDDIKNARYFHSTLFKQCVPRVAPSPRRMYWRVRAVFALFGNMIDSKTNKPLFNKAAWKKANRVLEDILLGLYSDPPGVAMYTKKLRPEGRGVQLNQYGMEMIYCLRGTNRTEGVHGNLHVVFYGWHTGSEMSQCLLGEFCHRHNQTCSKLRRDGHPAFNLYDTWLVDQLQNLYLDNQNIRLYPNWSNASDYR